MQVSIISPVASPVRFKGRRLQLGLCSAQEYNGFNPFLNWWKVGNVITVIRNAGGNISGKPAMDAGYLSADGELVSPVPADVTGIEMNFFTAAGNPGESYSGEQFTVTWTGTSTGLTLVSGGTGAILPGSTSPTTFTFGTITNNIVYLRFAVAPGSNNPPRNIMVYQSRYADAVAAGKKTNPDWIDQIKSFKTLRFMDLMATNGSSVVNYADFATELFWKWGNSNPTRGAQYGIPLTVIAEIAELTGAEMWVNIPHQASNTCVQLMAEFFRDNVSTKVLYEYSNECWNGNAAFTQTPYCQNTTEANTFWAGDGNRGLKWYGYRAAQCMKIIRDVYNDRTRWEGIIGTQSGNPGVLTHRFTGINYYLTNVLSNALTIPDLFDCVAVTNYFGYAGLGTSDISSITKANPAVVTTSAAHGLTTGDEVIFALKATSWGMQEIAGQYATVTVLSSTTFSINIDTTAYSTYTGGGYIHTAAIFRTMDQSESLHASNAVTYPTKYTYYEQVMSAALIASTDAQIAGDWASAKSGADANGLRLRAYEGGSHFVGRSQFQGVTRGNDAVADRFNEFLVNSAHGTEIAKAYARSFAAFQAAGGEAPAKFVEAGLIGSYGTWGGIRYWPFGANATGDFDNPVWKATKAANAVYFAP